MVGGWLEVRHVEHGRGHRCGVFLMPENIEIPGVSQADVQIGADSVVTLQLSCIYVKVDLPSHGPQMAIKRPAPVLEIG